MLEENPQLEDLESPQGGAFTEAAQFVRKLYAQGRITREEALRLTEQAYRDTMLAQRIGVPVRQDETPGDWPPQQT